VLEITEAFPSAPAEDRWRAEKAILKASRGDGKKSDKGRLRENGNGEKLGNS